MTCVQQPNQVIELVIFYITLVFWWKYFGRYSIQTYAAAFTGLLARAVEYANCTFAVNWNLKSSKYVTKLHLLLRLLSLSFEEYLLPLFTGLLWPAVVVFIGVSYNCLISEDYC